jgi:hypothetical protein
MYTSSVIDKYLSMPLTEKRKLYACGEDYVVLQKIPAWHDYLKNDRLKRKYPKGNSGIHMVL